MVVKKSPLPVCPLGRSGVAVTTCRPTATEFFSLSINNAVQNINSFVDRSVHFFSHLGFCFNCCCSDIKSAVVAMHVCG